MADEVKLDVPSAHQRYLESVLDPDRPVPVFNQSVNPSDSAVVSDDGYVGTDPIYQNHANDTEAPHQADGGADKLAEDAFVEAYEGGSKEGSDLLKENYNSVSRTDKEPEAPKAAPKAASKK